MKIGFLTPEYPHAKTGAAGGIGTSIKNLCVALKGAGHEPSVHVYGQSADGSFSDNGYIVHTIRNVKFKGISWFLTRKKIQRHLNAQVSKGDLDLVEAPDWTGITSFINLKCPVVIRLNGSDTYFCHLDGRRVKPWNRFHEKRALQKADALLSVSDFTARTTKELFGLNRNFTIIPNSIDASQFSESTSGVKNSILYFGTLIRKKGLFELPEIFNKVIDDNKSAQLILVGKDSPDVTSGSASTWKLIEPLFSGDAIKNVRYAGSVPYDQMRAAIDQAAVCVFPSFAEALPVSWLEAMAMGKAVVASDMGWATEIIREGKDGFMVDPKNHEAFADRILKLLSDESLRSDIGKSARKRILEAFDNKVVGAQNLAFYESILKR